MPNHNMGAATRRRRKQKLLRRYGSRCCYCRQPFPIEELTIEHRKPRSQGGSNAMWNLRLACFECNNRRGSAPLSSMRPQCWISQAPKRTPSQASSDDTTEEPM